ncbi:MAG: creatininase family protein, partial [Chloroflexota bacterium]
ERRHNQVIIEGVEEARGTTGMRGFVVLGQGMAKRLGMSGKEAHLLVTEDAAHEPAQFADVHAGTEETSVFWHHFPEITRSGIVSSLEPTNYGLDDLAEGRKGWENGRHKTPRGYLGDPAGASQAHGQALFDETTTTMTEAIHRQLRESPWLL